MAARFIQSASTPNGLPDLGLPEVAFVGRSNVGKSTLIGRTLGKPGLVRTSRTPGRTQLLNLFVLDEAIAIVDMPGYGYAKLPKTQRAAIDRLVQGYLTDRDGLKGVIQVVDARRDPVSDYDAFVSSWVLEQERPLLVALTKIDLIPKNRRLSRCRAVEKQLHLPAGAAQPVSGKTGEGLKELKKQLWELTA